MHSFAHTLFAIDWHGMLMPKPSWAEKVLRPVLVYIALLFAFRIGSKREMASATLFDFLIILLISNVVQNAIIGDDNSILGALAGAITLLVLSVGLNRFTAVSRKAHLVLEGTPEVLICDGKIREDTMARKGVSREDLLSAVRGQGLACLADVGYAILELNGDISIIKKSDCTSDVLDCLPEKAVGEVSAETSNR